MARLKSRRERVTLPRVKETLAVLEMATAQEVAQHLLVDRHFIRGYLEALHDLGVIEKRKVGQMDVYRLRKEELR